MDAGQDLALPITLLVLYMQWLAHKTVELTIGVFVTLAMH